MIISAEENPSSTCAQGQQALTVCDGVRFEPDPRELTYKRASRCNFMEDSPQFAALPTWRQIEVMTKPGWFEARELAAVILEASL